MWNLSGGVVFATKDSKNHYDLNIGKIKSKYYLINESHFVENKEKKEGGVFIRAKLFFSLEIFKSYFPLILAPDELFEIIYIKKKYFKENLVEKIKILYNCGACVLVYKVPDDSWGIYSNDSSYFIAAKPFISFELAFPTCNIAVCPKNPVMEKMMKDIDKMDEAKVNEEKKKEKDLEDEKKKTIINALIEAGVMETNETDETNDHIYLNENSKKMVINSPTPMEPHAPELADLDIEQEGS